MISAVPAIGQVSPLRVKYCNIDGYVITLTPRSEQFFGARNLIVSKLAHAYMIDQKSHRAALGAFCAAFPEPPLGTMQQFPCVS